MSCPLQRRTTPSGVALLLALLTVIISVDAATELSVTVYDGPTDCEDDARVKPWDFVEMHYVGSIDESTEAGTKGKDIGSSHDRGLSFTSFQVGAGSVIEGWEEGIVGLCKGAKANMVIPPSMAYGDEGAGDIIPAGATLHFDVEVVDILIEDRPPLPVLFAHMDEDQDGFVGQEEIQAFFKNMVGYFDDKDGDGKISWEEFSGMKGTTEPPPSRRGRRNSNEKSNGDEL
mmetsp:Transcript_15389/g.36902  ORF Transcript_15389/g.36902 Transcript_15389/m.36902 type:complete len:230 (-) Transcript_15389:82-771(-)